MKVRYTLRARTELEEIYAYLDDKNPVAARSVKAFIEQRIDWLAEFPFMAPATDEPGVYELTIVRYPYKVYYQLEGESVWIVHIRHTAREPWPRTD
jgi:plasmid stabilization system protein ParE